MGFNKRFVNKQSIQLSSKCGLNNLINYLTKPDCVIAEDEFSSIVYNVVISGRDVRNRLKKIGLEVNE